MTQTEQDPRRLLQTFLDVGVQLTQALDIETVLVSIVERAMEITDAAYGAAVTVTAEGALAQFIHRGLSPEEVALLPHYPRGEGLLGLVLKERAPQRIERISDHPASVGFPLNHVPMDAFLGVPMIHRGNLMGALYLTKPPDKELFTDLDEDFVLAIASMAAVGIANARLFAAETDRAERTALLSIIASRVRQSLELPDVLETTVEMLGRAAGVDHSLIRLVEDSDPRELGPIAFEWGTRKPSPENKDQPPHPVTTLAASSHATQWSEDFASDERLVDPAGAGAGLATPLMWGNELLGVVTVHSGVPRKWTPADIALIEAAAREVSVAIRHARMYESALEATRRLEDLDRLRAEFIQMISHELRSPMTVVGGIAEILRKRNDKLTSEQRTELIETLGREARRLTRLVSEVLDLEAIDRGALALNVGEVDLAALAREAVTDSGEASHTGLIVHPGDALASCDRDRIKQVLLNLISNSAKFSDEDTAISVTVTPQADHVSIAVADRGPGIPEEEKANLFKRFGRLSTGEHKPGSGLGLYLSRKIVEEHGGQIAVESRVGEGATFTVRLPRSS